ncbi:MAG: hypothetical protein ACKV2O_00625 [Acidimicrobiales bacterium]
MRIPLVLGLALGAVAVGHTPSVDAADPPVTITLKGSHMMDPLVAAWDAELFNLAGSVQVDSLKSNSLGGRQGILDGNVDAALSAVGFNEDDLAHIADLKTKGENPDFVTVPLNASALLFAELTPKNALHPADSLTPTWDVPPGPAEGYTTAQAMRMYMERPTLYDPEYAALHSYQVYDPGETGEDPPKPGDALPSDFAQIEIAARTGPSAMGWMMERMMKERAPDLWQRYLTRIKRPSGTLSEQIDVPFSFNGSEAARWAVKSYQPMMEAMLAFAAQGARPCCFFAGLPPWVMQQYRYHAVDLQPELSRTNQADLDRWELRPLKIDGVDPTLSTIAKALENGDGLSSTEPELPNMNGGYPASFINKMIVRTDTLKPERVNAMVDFIVYAVTVGQEKAVPLGDPKLPLFHVLRALAGANEIVTKSCPPERTVDGADVSLSAVEGAAGVSVAMKRCAAPPAPTTTTTTTTTTTFDAQSNVNATTTTTTATTVASRTPASSGFSNSSSNVVIANPNARSVNVSVPPVTAAPVETTTMVPVSAPEIDPDSLSGAELVAYYDVAQVPPPSRRRSPALQPLLGAAAFAVGASRGGRSRQNWALAIGPGS